MKGIDTREWSEKNYCINGRRTVFHAKVRLVRKYEREAGREQKRARGGFRRCSEQDLSKGQCDEILGF